MTKACWQFCLQPLPKDTRVSVVAEVLCLKEWAHAKWWFEKTKTNWENPKVWTSSSNQGQNLKLVLGTPHKVQPEFDMRVVISFKFQSLMVEFTESQPIDQGEWLPRARCNDFRESVGRNFQNVNAQNPILDLSLSRSPLISCWRMLTSKLS